LGFGIFERRVQRRGTHVNTLKIGSRDGGICFGGILAFYAELRREYNWRNLDWGFLEILSVDPREVGEEGGTMCAFGGI
jgi:hypothetical protein